MNIQPEIENEFHFQYVGSRTEKKDFARRVIQLLCLAKKTGFYNNETHPSREEVSERIKELRKELIQTI
jgi:hypothetical protein